MSMPKTPDTKTRWNQASIDGLQPELTRDNSPEQTEQHLRDSMVGRKYGLEDKRGVSATDPVETVDRTNKFISEFASAIRKLVSDQLALTNTDPDNSRISLVNEWLGIALEDEQVVQAFQRMDVENASELIEDVLLKHAIQFALHDQSLRNTSLTSAELAASIGATKERIRLRIQQPKDSKDYSFPFGFLANVGSVLLAILVFGAALGKDAASPGPTPTPAPVTMANPEDQGRSIPEQARQTLPTPTPDASKATPAEKTTDLPQVRVMTDANLRSGAGTSNEKIGSAGPGQILIVIEKNQDGSWLKVKTADNQVAWISSSLVEPIAPVVVATQEQLVPVVTATPEIKPSLEITLAIAITPTTGFADPYTLTNEIGTTVLGNEYKVLDKLEVIGDTSWLKLEGVGMNGESAWVDGRYMNIQPPFVVVDTLPSTGGQIDAEKAASVETEASQEIRQIVTDGFLSIVSPEFFDDADFQILYSEKLDPHSYYLEVKLFGIKMLVRVFSDNENESYFVESIADYLPTSLATSPRAAFSPYSIEDQIRAYDFRALLTARPGDADPVLNLTTFFGTKCLFLIDLDAASSDPHNTHLPAEWLDRTKHPPAVTALFGNPRMKVVTVYASYTDSNGSTRFPSLSRALVELSTKNPIPRAATYPIGLSEALRVHLFDVRAWALSIALSQGADVEQFQTHGNSAFIALSEFQRNDSLDVHQRLFGGLVGGQLLDDNDRARMMELGQRLIANENLTPEEVDEFLKLYISDTWIQSQN